MPNNIAFGNVGKVVVNKIFGQNPFSGSIPNIGSNLNMASNFNMGTGNLNPISNESMGLFANLWDKTSFKIFLFLIFAIIVYYYFDSDPEEEGGEVGDGSSTTGTPETPTEEPPPVIQIDENQLYTPYKVIMTTDISSLDNAEANKQAICETQDCFYDKRHRFQLSKPYIGINNYDINANDDTDTTCRDQDDNCNILSCSDGWAPSTSILVNDDNQYNHNFNIDNGSWDNQQLRVSPYIIDNTQKKIYIHQDTCSEQYCMLNYIDEGYHSDRSSMPTFDKYNLTKRNDGYRQIGGTTLEAAEEAAIGNTISEYDISLKHSNIDDQIIKENIYCTEGYSHGKCTVDNSILEKTEEDCNQYNNNRPECESTDNPGCKYIDNYDNIKYHEFFSQSNDGESLVNWSSSAGSNPREGISIDETTKCRQLYNSETGDPDIDNNSDGTCSFNEELLGEDINILQLFSTEEIDTVQLINSCNESITKSQCLSQSLNITDNSKINNEYRDNEHQVYFCNWKDVKEINYTIDENFCSNKCYPKLNPGLNDLNRRPINMPNVEESTDGVEDGTRNPLKSPWIMTDNEMIMASMKDPSSYIQVGEEGCIRNDVEYISDDPDEEEPDCSSLSREECTDSANSLSQYCIYNEGRYVTTNNDNYSFDKAIPYSCIPPFRGEYRYLMCSDKYGCKTNEMETKPDDNDYYVATPGGDLNEGTVIESGYHNLNNYFYYKNNDYSQIHDDLNLIDTVPDVIDSGDRYSIPSFPRDEINGAFKVTDINNTISKGQICNGGGNTFEIYSECTTQTCGEIMSDTSSMNCSRTDGYIRDEGKDDNMLQFSLDDTLQDSINKSCCKQITCLNHNGFEESETGFLCERDGEPWMNSRNYYQYEITFKLSDELTEIPNKNVIGPLIKNIFIHIIPLLISKITNPPQSVPLNFEDLDDDITPENLIKMKLDPEDRLYKYKIAIKNKSFTNLFNTNGELLNYVDSHPLSSQAVIPSPPTLPYLFSRLFKIEGDVIKGNFNHNPGGGGLLDTIIFEGLDSDVILFLKEKIMEFTDIISVDLSSTADGLVIQEQDTHRFQPINTDRNSDGFDMQFPTSVEDHTYVSFGDSYGASRYHFIVEVKNTGVPCLEGRCTHSQCCEIQTCRDYINLLEDGTSSCPTGTQAIVANENNKVIDPFCFVGTKYIEINNFAITLSHGSIIGGTDVTWTTNQFFNDPSSPSTSFESQITSVLSIDTDNPDHSKLIILRGYIIKIIERLIELRIKKILNILDPEIIIYTTRDAEESEGIIQNIKCKIYEDQSIYGFVTFRARIYISDFSALHRADRMAIFEENINNLIFNNLGPDGNPLYILPITTQNSQNEPFNDYNSDLLSNGNRIQFAAQKNSTDNSGNIYIEGYKEIFSEENSIFQYFENVNIFIKIQYNWGQTSYIFSETNTIDEYDSSCLNYNLIHSETPQNSPCCSITTCRDAFLDEGEIQGSANSRCENIGTTPGFLADNFQIFYGNNIPQSSELETSGCCGPQVLNCELPRSIIDEQSSLSSRERAEYSGYKIENEGVRFPHTITIKPSRDLSSGTGYNLNATEFNVDINGVTRQTFFTEAEREPPYPTPATNTDTFSHHANNYLDATQLDGRANNLEASEISPQTPGANLVCSNFNDPSQDSIRAMCIHIPDGDPRLYKKPFTDSNGNPPDPKPEGHYFYVFTGCKSDEESICRVPELDQYNTGRFVVDVGGIEGESRITNIDTLNFNEESGSYQSQCRWDISQSTENLLQDQNIEPPEININACSEEFGNIEISGCQYSRQFDVADNRYNYSYYQELDVGMNENIKINSHSPSDGNEPYCQIVQSVIENCSNGSDQYTFPPASAGNAVLDLDDFKNYGVCDDQVTVCSDVDPCPSSGHCNRISGGLSLSEKQAVLDDITGNHGGLIPSQYANNITLGAINERLQNCTSQGSGYSYTAPRIGICSPSDGSQNGENRICSYVNEDNTCASKIGDDVVMYPDEINCIYNAGVADDGSDGSCDTIDEIANHSGITECVKISPNTCIKRDVLSELSNTGVSGCTADKCDIYGGTCTGDTGEDEPERYPERFSCKVDCDGLFSNINESNDNMTLFCTNRQDQQVLEFKMCNLDPYKTNEYMCDATANCHWVSGECLPKTSLSPSDKPCATGYFLKMNEIEDVENNICSNFSGPMCISSGEPTDNGEIISDNECHNRMINPNSELINEASRCLQVQTTVDVSSLDEHRHITGTNGCNYRVPNIDNPAGVVDHSGVRVFPEESTTGNIAFSYYDLCNNTGLCSYDTNTNSCNIDHVNNIEENLYYHKCVPCGSETNNFDNRGDSTIVNRTTGCGTPDQATGGEQTDNINSITDENLENSVQYCSEFIDQLGFNKSTLSVPFYGVPDKLNENEEYKQWTELRNLDDFYKKKIKCNNQTNVKYENRNSAYRQFNKTFSTRPSEEGSNQVEVVDEIEIPSECVPADMNSGYVGRTSYNRDDSVFDNPCSNYFKNYKYIPDLDEGKKKIICETHPVHDCVYYGQGRYINPYYNPDINDETRYGSQETQYEIAVDKAIRLRADENTYLTKIEPCTSRFGRDASTGVTRDYDAYQGDRIGKRFSSDIMDNTTCYRRERDPGTQIAKDCKPEWVEGWHHEDMYGSPCTDTRSTDCSNQSSIDGIYQSSCIKSDNIYSFPPLDKSNISVQFPTPDGGQEMDLEICEPNKYLVRDLSTSLGGTGSIKCETCGQGVLYGFKQDSQGNCRRMFCECNVKGDGEDKWTNVEQFKGRPANRTSPCGESIQQLKNSNHTAFIVETCGGEDYMNINTPISTGSNLSPGSTGTYCSDAVNKWCDRVDRKTSASNVCKTYTGTSTSCGIDAFSPGRQIPHKKENYQKKFEPCLRNEQCNSASHYGFRSNGQEICAQIPSNLPGYSNMGNHAGFCNGSPEDTPCNDDAQCRDLPGVLGFGGNCGFYAFGPNTCD